MTAAAPARTPLFPSMRLAQVSIIDRAARALTAQVDDLDDAGLMADAGVVRIAVDGLYRTRAKLVELLRRDGLVPPPVPNNVVVDEDAIDGRCPGCGKSLGSEHRPSCAL